MKREIASLTGLRGFAALWVLLFHYSFTLKNNFPVNDFVVFLMGNGWVAVDLFFLLSGFILAYTYPNGVNFREFMVKRFARIYPLHVLVLLCVCAVWLVYHMQGIKFGMASWYEFLRQLLLVQTWWGHRWGFLSNASWSLSAEFAAYLFFPLLMVVTGKAGTFWQRLLLALVLMGIYMLMVLNLTNPPFKSGVLRALPCFITGILLFKMQKDIPARVAGVAADVTTVLVAAMGVVLYVTGAEYWYYIPLFAVWIAMLPRPSVTARVMGTRPMMFLGRISYSLYLIHAPMIGLLLALIPGLTPDGPHRVGMAGAILLLVSWVALTVALSTLATNHVEGPARRWLVARYRR